MKNAVKSIKLSAAKTVKAGKSVSVKATVKTTGTKVNKTLKWTSSNTKYATVNSKGKVTAKKAGKGKTVKITATATDGSGKKATVKIKIK
jgi:VCBS repeat-containing protein